MSVDKKSITVLHHLYDEGAQKIEELVHNSKKNHDDLIVHLTELEAYAYIKYDDPWYQITRAGSSLIEGMNLTFAGYGGTNGLFLVPTESGRIKVITGKLGEHLLKEYTFKTLSDTQEVFVYENGVYVPGENIIRKRCQELVGSELIKTMYVSEAVAYVQRATYVDREMFDRSERAINLKNGLYDIKEGKLKPHDPDYLSFIQLPIEYNEDAECPLWLKYLGEAVPTKEDQDILQEIAGWVFHPEYNVHKFVLLEGKGGNGKSVYLDTIQSMMGNENVSNIPWQELCDDKYAKGKLYGKMANIHSDLPKAKIKDTGTFKSLCGGDVRTWSDVKFSKDGISFYNRAKLIFAANHVPQSDDITDSFFQRIILITFPNKFRDTPKEDKELKNKLEVELPGIFNWAVEGLNRLNENKKFSTSKTTEQFREMFLKKSDSVFAFFDECLEEGDVEDFIYKDEMYQEYVSYCKKELDVVPIHKQDFGKDFPKCAGFIGQGQRRVHLEGSDDGSTRLRTWKGVKMKKVSHPGTCQGCDTTDSEPKERGVSQPSRGNPTLQGYFKEDGPGKATYNVENEEKKVKEEKILDKNGEPPRDGCDTNEIINGKTDQKARLSNLWLFIKNNEKKWINNMLPKSELIEFYKQENLQSLDEDIDRLIKDGKIYEAQPDRYVSII